MLSVYCPFVAVFRDDARHHFFLRIAALLASGLKKLFVTDNYGSGLLHGDGLQRTPMP
jgi:hypothetical protein